MAGDNTARTRIGRRNYLGLLAAVGLAGCSGSGDTGTETDSGGPLATPANTVATFYETLYGEDDLEGANELYHPESEAPPLEPANFAPYGGQESITADLQSTEIVKRGEVMTRIHAVVDYTSAVGAATHTDYFLVRPSDEQWLVDVFLPESAWSDMDSGNVTDIMSQE